MTDSDLKGWTIIFDLDGTLVDTAPDLHRALNHCLVKAGYAEVPFDVIDSLIGHGAKAMIVEGLASQGITLDEAEIEPVWSSFLDFYRQHICDLSRPYDGVEKALQNLSERGAQFAVCTNKTQDLAIRVLDGLELSRWFEAVRGADAVAQKKPDGGHILETLDAAGGHLEKSIMIGDSQTDERAARNAGLPFIFVSFGYGPAPEMSADKTAASFAELPALIRELALRPPQPSRR
ncbi:HAD hydrolase-like protein [Henriciella litoralis]|uniref:HAD hydrolase-like protein n=1 Tax=Henriciella litoralis TaxID=568102 RepID=UPI000A015719|nr:HAD hydrolase-like protein [Henriciella litoralis]